MSCVVASTADTGEPSAYLSVLFSLLLHARLPDDEDSQPSSRVHRVSLSDQRRSAQFASFSPSPAVSLLVFEDGLSTDGSSRTHTGPSAATQVKRLKNWALEQRMQFPSTFASLARVVSLPSLSPSQLHARRPICYVHNARDARRSCVTVCERVVLATPERETETLSSLVAGAWTLTTPIVIFDDRYGARGFWDFLVEATRCGANYFAAATGIIVDVQLIAVPLHETQPEDQALTVDLLWTPERKATCLEGSQTRKATVMCARDASQLDVIIDKARRADQTLRNRARRSHVVCSLRFFNHRTLRKASLTIVQLVAEDPETFTASANAAADTASWQRDHGLDSAATLESLITSATETNVTTVAMRERFMSTRLTAALYTTIAHFIRTKEYQNGALFHWICNVPCTSARRLPSHVPDQRVVEFRLRDDGDDSSAPQQAAHAADIIQRLGHAAQRNAPDFTLLDAKRSSLTAERLSVHMLAEHMPDLV